MNPDLLFGKTPDILVVDDTIDSLRLLSETLLSQGYEVRSVTSGTLALASVKAAVPDLILLDIVMPDLSGYEVCQQLKANPHTCDIPVLFISALNEPFDKVRAFQQGGVDYITKPFQLEEVLARIQNQLHLRFSQQQIQQLNTDLERRVLERTAQLRQANQFLHQEISERKQIEQHLRESEAKFRQLSEHITEVFWLSDFDPQSSQAAAVVYVSPAYEEIWGHSCESLYQDPDQWIAGIDPADRERVEAAFRHQVALGLYDEEYRVVSPDGRCRWIRDRGFPIHNAAGTVYRIAGIAEDITDRKQAELERDRFFNLSLDLLFIATSQGEFKRLNPAWETILGYGEGALLGQSWWQLVHPEDQPLAEDAAQRLHRGEDLTNLELRCRCQDDTYRWMAWNAVPFAQEHLIYGTGRDISQRKDSETRLLYETLHDSLTGLTNRAFFMERMELAIKKCRRYPGICFAVLFIDLDGFKDINDTLGHLVGDKLLIQVAQLLQESVREVDSVARLGGDEFTILLEDIQALKKALEVAERIQTCLKPAFKIDQYEIFTSASIGIVVSDASYKTVADIIRDADIAMYRAKASGKACYEVFDQTMYLQTLHLVDLETHLRHAVANQELHPYYQPIISLTGDMAVEGFEVLLRWHHSDKGIIPASEFIPIAEDTGLIGPIGDWVLKQACWQFSQWQARWPDFANLYLSINISGRQLRGTTLLQTLDQVLRETQIAPHCLKFEITESSLIENTQGAARLLQAIRRRGIQVSLDDFGKGFSSLSYLHQFPIDVIKIDQSFVQTIEAGNREQSIVASIVKLAQALGIVTVAEGIETQAQLKTLQRLGCTAGQGFWFAQPMSGQAMERFLQKRCGHCQYRYYCFARCQPDYPT